MAQVGAEPELLAGVCVDATYTDGMYGNFAGRDASRGMAKQSFDLGLLAFVIKWRLRLMGCMVDMLTPIDEPLDKLEDLTPEEMLVFSHVVVCVDADSVRQRKYEGLD